MANSVFDLSSLDGANGFVLSGRPLEFSGASVAAAGDVNGDGVSDLIIGTEFSSGRSYVVFGATEGFSSRIELSSLDGENGFVLAGVTTFQSVASAGDVNGDGVDDLIIGAPSVEANGQPSAGQSFVVFGSTAGFAANIDLSSLDGGNGFGIRGIGEGDRSGYSVAGTGDFNGDGIDDLIVGTDDLDPNGVTNAGDSYVVFGTTAGFPANIDLSSLDGVNGFVLNGFRDDDVYGQSVASAGDVNGDGINDLIIGASRASGPDEAYVVFGTTVGFGPSIDLSALDGSNGFLLNGVDTFVSRGISVASAGDVDGDGIGDLIIGAGLAGTNDPTFTGEAYVVFGTTAGFGASIELSLLNGTDGFLINGIDLFDNSGASVSSAGDVNGDGFDDLLIGASLADPNSQNYAGETYVVFGGTGGFPSSFNLSSLDGANGFVLNGIDQQDYSGASVSAAGDVNGDGIDDLIIGARRADVGGFFEVGESYVVFGSTAFGASVDATAFNDTLTGNGANNLINGLAGNDFIDGRDGNDTVSGGDGADSLFGGLGADSIAGGSSPDTINGGLGNDSLDGGTAFDTIDYSDRASGVNVNVINGVALTGGFVNSAGFYQGGVQEDTISNFENILGTGFADRLIAGSTSARIEGRGGNDFLFTFSGNDTLFGGNGNDFIASAKSSDQLFGENGNDTLNGGTGLDTLNGGANTDTADYSDREGGVSVNLVSNVAITGGALNGSGFYAGGFTEDQLVSIEAVFGSNFGDRLVAGNFASRLEGRGGNDNISGLSGADTLIGGAGNDTLGGGAGNDTFEFASGFGADRITDFAEGAGAGDVIRLVGLGAAFDSFAEVIAAASQSGGDVVFNFGGGNTITVASATVAGFAADDFTFG